MWPNQTKCLVLFFQNKMVRKRKKVEVEKPWCFYCDRVFNVGRILLAFMSHSLAQR